MLKGRARRFKTGFSKTRSRVRATPPRRNVNKPPDTFTPGKISDKRNIEKALKRQFLKKGFIY